MLVSTAQTAETEPQQARSRARKQALLEHGMTLFNTRGLDDVSIQEITAGVGFSTGSFYSYFSDKNAFFIAVQQAVSVQQDAHAAKVFAPDQIQGKSLSDRLNLCISFAIDYFRTHTGLVRAALSYERRIPEGWQPNRNSTANLIEKATVGLPPEQSRKLEIAIQMAFGLLVNALLHDPGPLHLGDPDLNTQIMGALTPFLKT